jgi:hypothetical protein
VAKFTISSLRVRLFVNAHTSAPDIVIANFASQINPLKKEEASKLRPMAIASKPWGISFHGCLQLSSAAADRADRRLLTFGLLIAF